jgi:hypothetical protein
LFWSFLPEVNVHFENPSNQREAGRLGGPNRKKGIIYQRNAVKIIKIFFHKAALLFQDYVDLSNHEKLTTKSYLQTVLLKMYFGRSVLSRILNLDLVIFFLV